VTCIPIVRQGLGKHIPAQADSRDNRTCKHASSTIQAVFSVGSVPRVYKWTEDATEYRRVVVEFRDASLPEIELCQVFGIGSCRIMERKELGGEKKTSRVS
jgi:hypothetical protein